MATATVTTSEWLTASADLRKQEKEATRLLESVAAKRRELPMLEIESPDRFKFLTLDGGHVTLPDLFEGRKQLIVYNHMPFNSSGEGCTGCSFFSDHVPHGPVLQHLQNRDTTFVATAPEDIKTIAAFKERMGWTFPFYACRDTWENVRKEDSHEEIFPWEPDRGSFRLNTFIKEGDKVYLTWTTTSRGVEPVLSTYALLDMTKLGRQDSSAGFQFHDRY